MAAESEREAAQELREELPGDSLSKSTHESVIPSMVEVRLSTGQGTTDLEMVLVCDLWIGEGTLYDPSTRTEINIWFDKGRLHLVTRGCSVKPGTRFQDHKVPDQPAARGQTTTETVLEGELSGDVGLGIAGTMEIARGAAEARAKGKYKTLRTTETVKVVEIVEQPSVSVTGDMWEVLPMGAAFGTTSISQGCRRFRYIDANDRLCDLEIRSDVKQAEVSALFFVYPSAIRYKITTKNAVARFRDQLSLNQSKIVDLLIKKGIPKHDLRGLQVAKASLRRKKELPRKTS